MGSASCLFILYRTAAISLFDPVVTSHKVRSVTGFISQRPENNRRMIFKSLHHPLISFEVSLGISRFLGQCPFAIPHPMRFDIGFTHDIQPIFGYTIQDRPDNDTSARHSDYSPSSPVYPRSFSPGIPDIRSKDPIHAGRLL